MFQNYWFLIYKLQTRAHFSTLGKNNKGYPISLYFMEITIIVALEFDLN